MKSKKFFFASLFLVVTVYFCNGLKKESDYYNPKILATHFNGEEYVGSETCMTCHEDIYHSHIQTAHFNTSTLATAEKIKGSFKEGTNVLEIEDSKITMLKDGDDFYQHTTFTEEKLPIPPEKIDIVVGSGVKGQSYFTWDNEKLFQLQVSYYPPTKSWINSPGFPAYRLKRPIRDGCLKCHVTFAKNLDFSGQGNQYDKTKIVYGIDCERCHRPAAKHVVFHRNNPEVTTSKYMLKLDTLSRQQRLDICAQCHSGLRGRIIKGNSFSFVSGENLDEYSRNFYTGQEDAELDVHGNQYGLLTSSKCFKQSSNFDCGTCHDSHKNQRGNATFFNEKCMGCHNENSVICSVESSKMNNNCISCHMPQMPSKMMALQLSNDTIETPVYVRTHLIKSYLETLYE